MIPRNTKSHGLSMRNATVPKRLSFGHHEGEMAMHPILKSQMDPSLLLDLQLLNNLFFVYGTPIR